MKVTDAQFNLAFAAYEKASPAACYATALLSAIESLPEPLPRLRPLSKMPPDVPEGAVRLFGVDYGNRLFSMHRARHDKVFIDVLPPLPESPKPSLQDELVTALKKIEKATHLLDPSKPLQYAQAITLMRECAESAIAKVKGGQQ